MNSENSNLFYFLLGLACTIPLSVLANVLTPTWQSWWVGRSQRRILKRIETIEKELARMDALTPNDLQNTVIQGIVLILLMVFQLNVLMVLMMISSSRLASLLEPIFETTNQFPYPLHLVFGMLFIAITLSLKKVLDELTLHTKIYRQQLLKEKANLESRLTQAGSS